MKPGDMIWQSRMPGGICILIEVHDTYDQYKKLLAERLPEAGDPVWSDVDFPVLQVLHPSEGLIEDPSYYYMTLKAEERYSRRRVAYELKKAGREVPDWLQKEIAEDETR